ncbi:hypothetical protein [Pararhizobium qamdonense]|uniref:hypothetical protein n=1 Tax=Pararhizobium qamdonense TaxID=3031126 RepID=UPI0023E0EF5D|nr:hypothetical protein [Pararhizobium qamdonense]
MKNIAVIVATTVCMLSGTALMAQEGAAPTAEGLLENVCIGGRLDENLLEPYVQQTAEFFKMNVTKLTPDMLATVNPDATSGWAISDQKQSFVIAFARKTVDGYSSASCSVATEAGDEAADAVQTFIQTKYPVRKIADQQQGNSTITAYRAELLGFATPKNFSVQRVHAGGGLSGMLMVSFFDSGP